MSKNHRTKRSGARNTTNVGQTDIVYESRYVQFSDLSGPGPIFVLTPLALNPKFYQVDMQTLVCDFGKSKGKDFDHTDCLVCEHIHGVRYVRCLHYIDRTSLLHCVYKRASDVPHLRPAYECIVP